jgi:hypothetical protein
MWGVFLTAVAVLLLPAAATACSIAAPDPPPTPRQEVDGAKRAVYGKVVARKLVGGEADSNTATYAYRFRVIETYKGSVRRRMRLVSGVESSMCEAGLLEIGDRFGLLLYKRGGPWRIDITSFISRKRLRASGYPARG